MSLMLKFNKDHVDRARKRAEAMGVLRNSFTGGTRTVNGFLGEDVFKEYCDRSGLRLRHVDAFTHDFVSENGTEIEVKTKTRNVMPQPHFDNGVCYHNTTQCRGGGLYVFLQLNWTNAAQTEGCVYFCGAMPADEFRRFARLVNPTATPASNGFVPTAGQLTMRIDECMDLHDFMATLRKNTDNKKHPVDTARQYTATSGRSGGSGGSGDKRTQ